MSEAATACGYWVGVHRIQLAIPPGTEQRVRVFYRDVLGMTEVTAEAAGDAGQAAEAGGTGGCRFRSGDLEFDFWADPEGAPPQTAHPGMLVARLAAHGVSVEWDHKFPGYRRFYVRDPLANRLEFLSPAPVVAGDS